MRLIDADALFSIVRGHHDLYRGATIPTDKARRDECLQFMCDINDAPTIYAVPVVRCRECKRWESLKYSSRRFCPKVHEWTEADFFCKWGQRREDGDTYDGY